MNETTFQSFYERTRKSLWSYIAGMMKDRTLADDIFQETYIKFIHSSAAYVDESLMKSYLYRIATNLMRDHWRRVKHERRWVTVGLEEQSTTDQSPGNELRVDIEKALQQLSHQQRSLLWLAYAENFEHREIAAILKVREKSVKVLLFRAKRTMLEVCYRLGITSETMT